MTLKQTLRVRWRLVLSVACLVLVFSAGLVSAQPICERFAFCDSDGDTYFRDHRKCRDCLGPRDCDDSDQAVGPCDGGPVAYTAELTAGAFVFRDENGQPVALNVFPAEGGDRLLSAETLYMLSPQDPDLQAVWDGAFQALCPGLGKVPPGILAYPDSWSILGYGGIRLTLRDFLVEDPRGDMWEVWIQLFGGEEPPWTEQSVFPLTTIEMWGKPADKKGRKSECGGVPFYPITSELTITATEP